MGFGQMQTPLDRKGGITMRLKNWILSAVMSILLAGMVLVVPHAANAADDRVIIEGGQYHSVAVKEDGTIWAWGYNGYGQLGDGTTTSRKYAVTIGNLTGGKSAAAGNYFSVVLKKDGTVWAWGINKYGQLGDGTVSTRKVPVQAAIDNVVAIAAGANHTLAIRGDGTLWAWGYNASGQLGDGTVTAKKTPVQVSGISDVVAVAAGTTFSMALKSDGTVWAWGGNGNGQLGDGTVTTRKTPVQVKNLTDVKEISAGGYFGLALTKDGTVWSWGQNSSGQLGNGTLTGRKTPGPVSLLYSINEISAGANFAIALKSDGTVWTWGQNNYGQIGDGTVTARKTPLQVNGLSTAATVIAAGGYHSVILNDDDTLTAWGMNKYGQLGDGTVTTRKNPVGVVGLRIALPNDLIPDDPGVVDPPPPDTDPGDPPPDDPPAIDPDQDLINAQNAVAYAEALANAGLYTQALIDADQQAYDQAVVLVNILTEGPDKTGLNDRLAVVSQKINDAKLVLQAIQKTDQAEALANGDLTTQSLLDSAQGIHDEALALVNALADGVTKSDLLSRLDVVQGKLDLAKAILRAAEKVAEAEAVVAGDLNTQALIDDARSVSGEASNLVEVLPVCPAKSDLDNRLLAVRQKIDEAQAVLDVTNLETLAQGDLTTQQLIDAAQQAFNSTAAEVNALAAGEVKTALQYRLAEVREIITYAQKVLDATLKVIKAEEAAGGNLSSQELVDAAQEGVDEALALVNGLLDSDVKTALTGRLAAAQLKVNEAQAIFDVTVAEQTRLQQDIDHARGSVAILPDGQLKTALTDRLDKLQKYVDAASLLNEILNSQLNTFDQIDQALAKLDKARTIIDTMPDGDYKVALNALYQKAENKIYNDLIALLGKKTTGKPTPLSDRSLELLVKYAIQKVGATSLKDRGKVMGFVMPLVNNRATGDRVNQIMERLLPAK